MKKIITLSLMLTFLAGLVGLVLAEEKAAPVKTEEHKGLKKRIAVVDFEDKTGHGEWHIGSGMADMLTTALVKSGHFLVIERQQLEKVLQEQAMGQTGAITAQSASQVGKVLGTELIVLGSVNEFGEKATEVGGGVGSKLGGKLGGLRGVEVQKKTARVGLDIRLVNTTTGIIEAAEGIAEEESKKGISVATDEFDFSTGAHFDETLAGKATRKAVDKAVALITEKMSNILWSGKVIKVNPDGSVLMKPGLTAGVKVGDTFVVYSLGEPIIDPDTGLEIGREEKKAGSVEVVDVKDQFAKAKVLSGTGFKIGDSIREQ